MKQYICEIIRTEYSMHSYSYNNDKEYHTFLYINPHTFTGMCARRYDTIYCDSHFLDDSLGRKLIKYVFKPMATRKGGKGFILINN